MADTLLHLGPAPEGVCRPAAFPTRRASGASPTGAGPVGDGSQGRGRQLELTTQPRELAGAYGGHAVEQLLQALPLGQPLTRLDAAGTGSLNDELPVDDEVAARERRLEGAQPGGRVHGRRGPRL